MDSFVAYGSGSSDSEGEDTREALTTSTKARQYIVNTAPDVDSSENSNALATAGYLQASQGTINYNIPYSIMAQPESGPQDSDNLLNTQQRVMRAGTTEVQAVDETLFRTQERMFRQKGIAVDPSIGYNQKERLVGPGKDSAGGNGKRSSKNNRGLRRKAKGDPSVLDGEAAYAGPWAGYEDETKGTATGPTPEQVSEYEAKMAEYTDGATGGGEGNRGGQKKSKNKNEYKDDDPERTTFLGKSERDYQGRTYMHVPPDLAAGEPGSQTCFAPKRLVKEWKAHSGGVSAIRFIPDTGHLLLSSGMDGLVKIYDTHRTLRPLRTYIGHSKAVRDISFALDGRSFLSSSYDGYTKLWDTETGQCKQRFKAGGRVVPYVARFYPEDPNVFLVGQGNKKIVQWDIRANETIQEYDQHLGAINSILFIDNNRRFVSSSDDKSMRVWEYGIPVVIKLIADPTMHSVPSTALHPSGKWFVGQSMDNQLLVFSAGERIKPHRRKVFTGHLTAGYACEPSISPDGRFITSGDSEGQVWCWNWQNAKVVTKWKAHDQVTICTAWHPKESSKVATCSWDGSIKYWD